MVAAAIEHDRGQPVARDGELADAAFAWRYAQHTRVEQIDRHGRRSDPPREPAVSDFAVADEFALEPSEPGDGAGVGGDTKEPGSRPVVDRARECTFEPGGTAGAEARAAQRFHPVIPDRPVSGLLIAGTEQYAQRPGAARQIVEQAVV